MYHVRKMIRKIEGHFYIRRLTHIQNLSDYGGMDDLEWGSVGLGFGLGLWWGMGGVGNIVISI